MRALQEDDSSFDQDSIASNDEIPVPDGLPVREHPLTMTRVLNQRVMGSEVTIGYLLLGLVGIYLLTLILRYLRFKVLNSLNRNLAKKVLDQRNERQFTFKVSHLNAQEILAMDVSQLRQGLLDKVFTSEDLVNFYGNRCYVFGRKLSLTT